ncbi:glycosyltransferase family 4 protein [Ornithinimicrobium pekingense]|uniref:D-inositol 3-phosphate glycosyltransferase n=1 Tax=Ornithinimicrobium pekingense TaxID=384677 RepID=A0ABQ2F617_9MICO|nr:glycosyltransferase family 4 protein [Ornithinimicrobium pekingense]GGK56200.1 hypothetical protein GCM10011509_00720 [Ornithinimicrobium pekingense]
MTLTLVVPDRPAQVPSGGDRYDAALVARWRRLGRRVEVVAAAGGWPWPSADETARLDERLRAAGGGPVVLDGLVGCAAPEVVATSAAVRPTVLLVHSLLADGAGAEAGAARELDERERHALRAATAVVTTGTWARERLAARHGVTDAAVALPGTDPAPVAPGSLGPTGTPGLLSLGALTPLKNHAVLLAALQQVDDLPWSLVVAGPAPDVDHLSALVADADDRGLSGRVRWTGALAGDALEAVWAGTDLLVHPSRSETYGMVVAEALAHGIPAVVGAGTGAVEALTGDLEAPRRQGRPGEVVAPDGPAELAAVLRRWLAGPALRATWREAALERRAALPGWGRTVERIDRVLGRIGA